MLLNWLPVKHNYSPLIANIILVLIGHTPTQHHWNWPLYYWGEPERAPHRRVCCKFSIYIYICRTSCRKSLPALILRQSTFRSNSL